jgi:hypothetical protein
LQKSLTENKKMNIKGRNLLSIGLLCLTSCALLPMDPSPPKDVFEAWTKTGVYKEIVIADMRSCGYRNVVTANDISTTEASSAEACMIGLGYKLDLSSYKSNNCYGQNSPYFCNRYWGGGKPVMVPVRQD